MGDHVRVKGLRQLVWPLDESEGPSQLHGHGPWLVCEVALSIINTTSTKSSAQGPYERRVRERTKHALTHAHAKLLVTDT